MCVLCPWVSQEGNGCPGTGVTFSKVIISMELWMYRQTQVHFSCRDTVILTVDAFAQEI